MPRTHEPECIEAREKEVARHNWWVNRFPDYCKTCNGTGILEYPGTYWDPPSVEFCSRCTGDGECPQCAELLLNSDLDGGSPQCRKCGWQDENPLCKGIPYVREDYDCSCSYEEV